MGRAWSFSSPLTFREGEDLHLGVPRLDQGLADEAGKVGPPAGVPRRGHQQGGVLQVVGPAAQGQEVLPQAQVEGVAHVVVGIPQPQLRRPLALVQDHREIVPAVEGVLEQGEVVVQHGGDQEGPLARLGNVRQGLHRPSSSLKQKPPPEAGVCGGYSLGWSGPAKGSGPAGGWGASPPPADGTGGWGAAASPAGGWGGWFSAGGAGGVWDGPSVR